ncbi:MAG: hypothetical protein ACRD8W_00165 [Nitrososphaeraceae archaeon]
MKLLSILLFFTRIISTTAIPQVILSVVVVLAVLAVSVYTVGSEHVIPNLVNAQEQQQKEPVAENVTLTPKYTTDGISQKLNYAHFVPVGPLSNSIGNQVKLLINYTVDEPSLSNQQVNAIMEVYNSANKSLIRTSSYPNPLLLESPEGTIQLATTLNDKDLRNVTAVAVFTDNEKVIPISNPLETRLSLGQMMR